jgi:hypothetical protein
MSLVFYLIERDSDEHTYLREFCYAPQISPMNDHYQSYHSEEIEEATDSRKRENYQLDKKLNRKLIHWVYNAEVVKRKCKPSASPLAPSSP